MKNLHILILCGLFTAATLSANPWNCGVPSVNGGANLTATLNEDGTLIISGTGEMAEFNTELAPWYGVREEIETVIIHQGVTSIGDQAFRDCSNLLSVTIPSSVASIIGAAFVSCTALAEIKNYAVAPQEVFMPTFMSIPDLSIIKLRVPVSSVDAYLSADIWKDFDIGILIDTNCENVIDLGDLAPKMAWVLCEDGTLIIGGEGEMPIFSASYNG